jgi:hypothetical protein
MPIRINDDGTLPTYRDDTGRPQLAEDVETALTAVGGEHPDLAAHTTLGLATEHAHPYAADDHAHADGGDHPDLAAHTTLGLAATGHDHSGTYSAAAHDHDADYADTAHSHAQSDVTSLTTDLDGKAASDHNHDAAYSASAHTHSYAETSHSHVDGDLPAGLARDAEVTSAIATHAATPHGGEGGGVTLAEVIDTLYPVGSLYASKLATNPGTLLGRGTWVRAAEGEYLVGQTGAQAGGASIGSATHSHAYTPSADHTAALNHTHGVTVTDPGHAHVQGVNSATTGGLSGYTPDTSSNTRVNSGYSTSSATTGISAATANPAGGVAALTHDGAVADGTTAPPGYVLYLWERTA